MTLSIIGAGFGRTGTESMKQALEQLGMGRCHHMHEVIASEQQLAYWRAIVHDGKTNWDEAFDGFSCSIDWPSAYYWRELADYYPQAKILLTTRSAESWYTSFSNTILKALQSDVSVSGIAQKLIGENVFGGRADDRNHAIAVFERNVAQVQAAFSSDRLLTYTIGDGWEPLCKFLGKPVPDTPFPRSNSTKQFNENIARERAKTNKP